MTKPQELNAMRVFRKILWEYDSKEAPLSESIFKQKWEQCQVFPLGNDKYRLKLESRNEVVENK